MIKIYLADLNCKSLLLTLSFFYSLLISNEIFGQTQTTFSTAGASTYTVPPGVTKITVECWGGGGNGGSTGNNGTKTGGGGGGAYARKVVTVTPSTAYNFTVGGAAGDSWFGSTATVSAKGGLSVVGAATTGAAGGSAASSVGDQTYSGGNGGTIATNSGGGGSSAGNSANGNNASGSTGGVAPVGGGAGANGVSSGNNGGTGNTPGGGGSGGSRQGVGGALGAGAAGQVKISYYSLTSTTSISPVCSGSATSVTISNSTTSLLPTGSYTVTYNLSGANTATGNTAAMTVSTQGTGTFTTAVLPNGGATTITITNLAAGFYSSSIGASNTSTFTVSSVTQPTISAGGPTVFCSGGSVILTATASGAISYQWYKDGAVIGGATNQTYTANASGDYTVEGKSGSCVSTSSSVRTVVVNALPATPSISASGPTTFCADGSLTLTSSPAASYQWYKGGVIITGEISQTYLPTTSGTYTVIVKNASGCSSAASLGTAVIVNPLPPSPVITTSGPTTFCLGGSVTLTSDLATTYQWYDDNGIITGATGRNFTASSSGSYVVRITNASGCTATSLAKVVTNNPLPDITIAPEASSLCSSTSSQVSELEYTNTNNSPITYTVTWSAAAITAGFINVADVNLPSTPITLTVPANAPTNTYGGTLTVKNANGCQSSSKPFIVRVTLSPNVTNFSIAAANGCAGLGAVITVNSTSIGDGTYVIKYDLSGANTSTATTSTLVFNGNSGTFTAEAFNAGITNITITEVSLSGGCPTPINSGNTASFTINALPAAAIFSGPDEVCVDATIDLDVNTTGGIWTSSEPSVASVDNNGIVTGLMNGSTIITYTTALSNGCTNNSTKTITVKVLPIVEAITGQTALCVGTISDLDDPTANGTWSSSNTAVATIDNITGEVSALSIGSTVITFTTQANAAGCTNATAVTVSVNADPAVTAGTDLEACQSSSPIDITLSGASYSGGATSALWSIENGGSGSLSSQGAGNNPQNVKYTPAANFYGIITLKLATNSLGTCGAATAFRTINITEKPIAIPGSTIPVCQNASPSPITLVGASVGGSASTGAWSIITGGGLLSDDTQVSDPASVTYTPAANFSGTVTLRLTTNAFGICGVTTADRTITVTATPVVNAGSQNSICQSAAATAFPLTGASISGGAGTAAWSITDGTGTLSSTAPTANPSAVTFKPDNNFFGTVKLTLTSDASGGCGAVTSERVIDVTLASTVIAGGPDNVCQSATPVAFALTGASIGGGATTGAWSIVSGLGTLSSTDQTNNPAAVTFTPDVNFSGSVSLALTSNATGNCSPITVTRTVNVTPNGTITLTSAAGTDAQINCISTPILNITYAVGGNATGASITAGLLPAGVNGSYNAGTKVFTISGSPSVSGNFSYTITTAGPCTNNSLSGTMNVNANSTITLSSAAVTTSQAPCINTAMTAITYTLGGGATGATFSAFPTGVSGTVSGNTVTISGTPTVLGNFAYTVTTTGPCVNTSLGGTINVKPDATITLTSAAATTSQTPCINTPITAITYTLGGGATAVIYSGLPGGVTGSLSGTTVTISGTPNVSGPFTYTVTSTGTCAQTNVSGTITISPAPVGGTISSSQVICKNATFSDLTLGGNTGNVLEWQSAADPNFTTTITHIPNITTILTGSSLATTTYYRALIQSGACVSVFSSVAYVAVNPPFTPIFTATPATICLGQSTTLSTLGFSTADTLIDGDFSNPKPLNWTGGNGDASNNNNSGQFIWGKSNGNNIGGKTYSSAINAYFIVSGTSGSILTTPSFSTVGRTSLLLEWYQGYNFLNSTIGTVEISINGGTSWTVLRSYTTGSTALTNPFTNNPKQQIDLNSYLGQPTVKVRFNYASGSVGSAWAIDEVNVVGPYQPVTYSVSGPGFSGTGSSVTVTPPSAGSISYSIQTTTGGCSLTNTTVIVNVNDSVKITAQPSTLPFCVGSNASITVNATGSSLTYQWQLSTTGINGTYAPFTIAAPYSVTSTTTSTTLNLNTPAIALSSNYYKVVLTGATSCGAKNSNPIALKYSNVWMGTTDNNWNTASNWSDGNLPSTACQVVHIPSRTNQPTLSATTQATIPVITDLLIYTNAVLTVTNATMRIAGTITNNGTFDVGNGSLDFNGTSAQSIAGSYFLGNTMKDLILSNPNGLSVSSAGVPLNIKGELAFGNVNNATLTTGNNIVLLSTVNSTARVADITNGGANLGNRFNGKVTVERFYPALRSWRLVTAPVSNTGSILSNWQNGGTYTAGRGVLVTGLNPTGPTGNGLDPSFQNNYSLKYGSNSDPVIDTRAMNLSNNTSNAANIGYFLFVRGDRDPNNTIFPNTNITTISSKGDLQTGPQTFPVPAIPRTFSLIGNPYASPVNFSKITRNNVSKRFYAWDPHIGGINGAGAYVLLDDYNNTGTYSYSVLNPPGGQDSIIQSSQAIFVETDVLTVPSSVRFDESDKDAKNNLGVFRPLPGNQATSSFRITLVAPNVGLLDGTLAEFYDKADAGVGLEDALKFTNINETVSFLRNKISLAIERRPTIISDDTLFLQLTKTTQRRYRFEFASSDFDPLLTAFLEDSYTGLRTPLNIAASTFYDFDINGDVASVASDRFRVVFKQGGSGPLPVTIKSVRAYQQTGNITVEWTVENEINISSYEVERSTDGVNFAKISSTASNGTGSSGIIQYNWLDVNPQKNNNFYRIKVISADGSFKYSDIVVVKMGNITAGIRIYPNPVEDGLIVTEFKNMAAGIYKARLINGVGQVIWNQSINHAPGTSTERIQPGYRLASGTYQLIITAPDKKETRIKVIVK
ncbi:MAG: hypothetical protein JWP81_2683 [Ferruginibacter sp.]|nr:hypothetical protein [Ferruginibacter sp.]